MAKFVAHKGVLVLLHDEDAQQIGVADLRDSAWEAPDDDQAEAMRRVIPLLGEYGVRELANGEDEPAPPKRASKRKGGKQVQGRVTSQTAKASEPEPKTEGANEDDD